MRELVYYVAVSIDGYIAGPDGEYDFYPGGDEAQHAAYMGWMNQRYPETVPTAMRPACGLTDAPNRHFDTVLMGLGAYRPGLDAGMPSPYAHLRQYVVSSTLGAAPDPAVTVVDGDPLALVRDLKREEGQDIWLCGGGRLAGTLLPEIDRLIVKSYPVVAGAGIPAFHGAFNPTVFRVTDRELFDNGVTVTWFTRR
ncbi:riboflavin biosynthesis, RibD domain-containing protein [Streptomyces himastatinicus ATCC 53653]|uniref:Riboflavin biosynthesis, RibD domain-containing protein n=1 Tax=Streptomyces himastatinicus ATCC 53653 TaxID=457427 RepID=D9WE90_9ACTN|nr:dihydrofolate reductase family protein [Streptomyces himastatinicus]EFL23129.1 riboflavin biosynthesis, RibD domain-containing protein [Streptomyces himastatinicus ATCC 53653]